MAIVTPATTAVHSKLVDPGVKKIFFDEYKQYAPKLERLFNVSSSSALYNEYMAYAGLSEAPLVEEGGTYTEDAIVPTYGTTLTQKKYGFLVPVSYELGKFQFDKIAGKVQTAARALVRKYEGLASDVLNNAFSTSYTSFGDGLPLASTAHTSASGGSNQSNASATGITLTEANLETGIVAMREQLDDRGNMVDIVPNKIIVPPALEKEALIITKSDKRSDSADNDANVYKMREYTGGMLDVIVWDYIGAAAGGSDTAWFLADSAHNKMMWEWSEKPMIEKLSDAVGAKNDIMYWKARFMAAYGWADFRGFWASKGDGAAYAS